MMFLTTILAPRGVRRLGEALCALPPIAQEQVMNQYGDWRIVQTNDGLARGLPEPRIVTISPGKFKLGKLVHGKFQLESRNEPGVFVSMSLFNLGFMKRTYQMCPMTDSSYMMLLGTGSQEGIYYMLHRHGYDSGPTIIT